MNEDIEELRSILEWQFIENKLRRLHDIFSLLTEDTATTYLERDLINRIGDKMLYSTIVYDLARAMGLDNTQSMRLAVLALVPELSKAYLYKSYRGFIAKILKALGGGGEEEFEGERKQWGWFRK